MRALIFGLVALMTGTVPALADSRDNAMNHIAQVTAVVTVCPRLVANDLLIVATAGVYGIDLKRDQAELMPLVIEQLGPLQRQSEDDVCTAGLLLYGPAGMNVKGLLREK